MDQQTIFLTILGMTLVTYLPRLVPVLVLSSRSLPRLVIAWLRLVPMAVLAALVAPSLFVREGRLTLDLSNIFLLATLPTLLVAWRTKNLFLSVVVGMVIVAISRALIG
jgi:branched-subunit amino acid transport protein